MADNCDNIIALRRRTSILVARCSRRFGHGATALRRVARWSDRTGGAPDERGDVGLVFNADTLRARKACISRVPILIA
jgi:hypothetical protein